MKRFRRKFFNKPDDSVVVNATAPSITRSYPPLAESETNRSDIGSNAPKLPSPNTINVSSEESVTPAIPERVSRPYSIVPPPVQSDRQVESPLTYANVRPIELSTPPVA